MQHDAADELHIEMPHVQEAAARFARQGERGHDGWLDGRLQFLFVGFIFGIGVFQALLDLLAQLRIARCEVFRVERLDFRLARVDGRDDRLQFFDVAFVLGADKPSDDII